MVTVKVLKVQTYHCVKGVRIRSYSGPYFPAFGLKIRNRITPNTDFFQRILKNVSSNALRYCHAFFVKE